MERDNYLSMSGIQHFAFCRRQWGLIHLEQQWSENLRTAQGHLLHKRCHDESSHEKRGDLLILRGIRVISHQLRLSGICDVVEFHSDPNGISLQGQNGLWTPMPVEYKRGVPKSNDADRLQLCAQAMALEEMLVCTISYGALFYAEPHRRDLVELTPALRQKTLDMAQEMNRFFDRGYTPKAKPGKHCSACSLKELCLPSLARQTDPTTYIQTRLHEEAVEEVPL